MYDTIQSLPEISLTISWIIGLFGLVLILLAYRADRNARRRAEEDARWAKAISRLAEERRRNV